MRPTYNILGDDDPEEDLWSVLAVDMDVCEGDPEKKKQSSTLKQDEHTGREAARKAE
eukprot:CAMPEP_0178445188 /NCGR_PEP_ID=MMETSP0689_2-20121128/40003_1 /TAXON_ID=160604 /ORGANISM="Amphidinium massartii, Strain CS-259" /LENGTH=56 /DNA_ID=CAMNT_0020069661 /DNA_START=48 /DNA_END=216 /DNA_ORIENTATION=-